MPTPEEVIRKQIKDAIWRIIWALIIIGGVLVLALWI